MRSSGIKSPKEKDYYYIVNNSVDIRPYRIILKKAELEDLNNEEELDY